MTKKQKECIQCFIGGIIIAAAIIAFKIIATGQNGG